MKVGIDGRYAEGNLVGIGKYIKNLCEGLSQRGVECFLFHSYQPKIEIKGKRIRKVLLNTRNRYYFEQVLLPKVLKEKKISVYHAAGNTGIPIFTSTPSVLTVHDIIPLDFKGYFNFSRFPRLSETSYLFRLASSCMKAKKIIAVSDFTKKRVIKTLGVDEDKIKVIYSGVKTGKISSKNKISLPEYFVLNHGGIDVRKNLEGLIRAFKLVRNRFPELKIVITGENPNLRPKLENLAQKLKISDSVIFTGYVREDVLWSLIRNAVCICYPSLMEGYGAPVLEGFAAGIPVITSNVGSLPEVAGDAAILINPRDPNEIAKAIGEVLSNRKKTREMIIKGKKRAKEFTWEKTIEETINLYREVVG